MAETETKTPLLLAAPPVLLPPPDESFTAASPPTQTPLLEKIRGATEPILQKFKIGRGRPRADGSPKKSDIPLAAPSPALPGGAAAAPVVDPNFDALFRRSVLSAVKGVLGFAKNLVRSKAGAAGLDKDFTERTLRECEPEPEVMADFSESLEIVLQKYNAKTQYAPEIALAIAASRLGSPYVMLLKSFNAEIARRKAAELKAKQ
jgi:hypothetical protein